MSELAEIVLRRVYHRLMNEEPRFRELASLMDEASIPQTLDVWDWFEKHLDSKEAHEEAAAADAAEPPVQCESWDS